MHHVSSHRHQTFNQLNTQRHSPTWSFTTPPPPPLPPPPPTPAPPPPTTSIHWIKRSTKLHCGKVHHKTELCNKKASIRWQSARHQFQATGQPVSQTQAAALWGKVCATQVLPMGVGPFAFKYQGNGGTPANILIPLERQLIALQLCH